MPIKSLSFLPFFLQALLSVDGQQAEGLLGVGQGLLSQGQQRRNTEDIHGALK